jgi:hypothetical protein
MLGADEAHRESARAALDVMPRQSAERLDSEL